MKSDKELLEETFWNLYNNLDKRGQIILQICAFLGRNVSRTTIHETLQESGLPRNLRLASPAQANIYLENFRQSGLTDYRDVIDTRFVDLALKQSVREGYYEILAESIKGVTEYDNVVPMMRSKKKPTVHDIFRLFRNAVLAGDQDTWEQHRVTLEEEFDMDPFHTLLDSPFDPELLATLPLNVQLRFLLYSLDDGFAEFLDVEEKIDYLLSHIPLDAIFNSEYSQMGIVLGTHLLFAGRFEEAGPLFKRMKSIGMISFLESVRLTMTGQYGKALKGFEKDLKTARTSNGKKAKFIGRVPGVFYALSLLYANTPASLKKAELNIRRSMEDEDKLYEFNLPDFYLKRLIQARKDPKGEIETFEKQRDFPQNHISLFLPVWSNTPSQAD